MFAGSIEGENTSCCGGFVGWLDATSSIYNCLMMGDMKVIADGGNTWARNPDRLNIADSYYLTPHAAVAGLPITAAQLESGEGCYLLNGSKNKNPGWYQTLGTDKIPYPDHHTSVWEPLTTANIPMTRASSPLTIPAPRRIPMCLQRPTIC